MSGAARFLVVFACLFLGLMAPHGAGAVTNVLFILDASGSMWGRVDGRTKMDVARQALKTLNRDLWNELGEMNNGLMVYGHRSEGDCNDIELVTRVSAVGPETLAEQIDRVSPKGKTPLAQSITQAATVFPTGEFDRNVVILLTDGIESCNGDPCRAAASLRGAGVNVTVNVVGFDLSDQDRAAVQCIADEGGGRYYDAKNAPQLTQAMTQVRQQVVQAQPAPQPAPPPAPQPAANEADINLLSPANGGELLVAPEEHWKNIIIENDGARSGPVRAGQEGIFAFKDERPATFSKFTMLIKAQDGGNPKEFELFASDALAGPFRSLGKFTTQNVRLMRSPHQEFTFPPTTARYFKVKAISAWNPGLLIGIPQIRLMGRLN